MDPNEKRGNSAFVRDRGRGRGQRGQRGRGRGRGGRTGIDVATPVGSSTNAQGYSAARGRGSGRASHHSGRAGGGGGSRGSGGRGSRGGRGDGRGAHGGRENSQIGRGGFREQRNPGQFSRHGRENSRDRDKRTHGISSYSTEVSDFLQLLAKTDSDRFSRKMWFQAWIAVGTGYDNVSHEVSSTPTDAKNLVKRMLRLQSSKDFIPPIKDVIAVLIKFVKSERLTDLHLAWDVVSRICTMINWFIFCVWLLVFSIICRCGTQYISVHLYRTVYPAVQDVMSYRY